MASKEPIDNRTVKERRQPAVLPTPAQRTERTAIVRPTYVLPARFLEGTAWDEV